MTKIFLDTNIWLRFFLKDNDQFNDVEKLMINIEEGRFLPYVSSIVFLEIAFVLQKTYGLPHPKVVDYLRAVNSTRNLTVIEKTHTPTAIKYFQKYHIKYSDCLIASQIKPDMTLVTYDQEFSKIKNLTLKTPTSL